MHGSYPVDRIPENYVISVTMILLFSLAVKDKERPGGFVACLARSPTFFDIFSSCVLYFPRWLDGKIDRERLTRPAQHKRKLLYKKEI
jgi:hypothetical protein